MNALAYDLIAIGCSRGGTNALRAVLNALPDDFCVPIAIVQHRHPTSAEGLPAFLRRETKLHVSDVEDKQRIEPGHVYLAPANYHLLVERGEFQLSVEEPLRYSRPSIDILFESAADAYRDRVIGVVLTGSNDDGAEGAARIKKKGGLIVVQDPVTAEAPEMPRAVLRRVAVDRILPLVSIGPFLVEVCRTPARIQAR
ncbi:MAG TPA: chemotaxis protein CheB [Thermoanaerobaculia bacterium]|nr:chemotaxis protein CheB [Thermoanaerobaculia bacterium]